MTATTLGDLFPEMRHAVPGRERKSHPTPESPGKPARHVTRQGTADRLKMLYPEIESWNPVLVTQAWFNWLRENQMALVEPQARDERFPDYLVGLIIRHMQETKAWI